MGVQRRLVVVARPDVVDAAAAFDEELVDIGRRSPDVGIGWTRIALLVSAEPNDAAAGASDIAGREREVHDGAVGAVVVVPPDDALLVAEHRAAPLAAGLRLGDPLRRFDDVFGLRPVIFAASSIEVRLAATAEVKSVSG